jgi:hypothetical protein
MTIHGQRLAEFLKRIPTNAPARIADDITTSFAIVATAREKIAAIRADSRLSREGQDVAIAAALAKGPLPHMKQLRAGVERDLAGIRSEREGMRRGVTTSSGTYTESQRQETRTWLRSLPENERRQLVYSTKNPRIVESITTEEHYLSGLSAEAWEHLTTRIVETKHHDRLTTLAVQEAAFEEAEAAIAVAGADISREAGLNQPTIHPALLAAGSAIPSFQR